MHPYYRSKKAVRAFEEQSRAEERQLVRMGLRRHLGLHTYYSSVKVRRQAGIIS